MREAGPPSSRAGGTFHRREMRRTLRRGARQAQREVRVVDSDVRLTRRCSRTGASVASLPLAPAAERLYRWAGAHDFATSTKPQNTRRALLEWRRDGCVQSSGPRGRTPCWGGRDRDRTTRGRDLPEVPSDFVVNRRKTITDGRTQLMEAESSRHLPRNRANAVSKVRRGGKHCPVCLAPLPKTATRTRLKRKCAACAAQPIQLGRCRKCGADAVWAGPAGATCQSCGVRGTKQSVVGR